MYKRPQFDEPFIENNPIEKNKISELFSLIKNFNKDEIQQFIINYDMNLNFLDENSRNLIHHCIFTIDDSKIEFVRLNIIRYLVSNSVNPDEPDIYNVTPLHIACKKQYTQIIKYLLDNGCNINYKDNSGRTPLHYLVDAKIINCISKKLPINLLKPKENKSYTKISLKKEIKKKIWKFFKTLKIPFINSEDYYDENNEFELVKRLEKLFLYQDNDFTVQYKDEPDDIIDYNNIDYFEDLYLSVLPNYDPKTNNSSIDPLVNKKIDFLNENLEEREKVIQFRNNLIELNKNFLQDIKKSITNYSDSQTDIDLAQEYLTKLNESLNKHSELELIETDEIVYIEQDTLIPKNNNLSSTDKSWYVKKDDYFYKCKFFVSDNPFDNFNSNIWDVV